MDLLIDDQRDIGTQVIVRTSQAALALLGSGDPPYFDVIFFDNDLGMNSEQEGQDLLRDLLLAKKLPYGNGYTKIGLVTSNPVAKERMEATLKADGYQQDITTRLWSKS